MARFTGLIGLIAILLAAYFFSTKRSAIQRRVVLWGIFLQFSFAYIVLKTPFGQLFYVFSQFVNALLNYSSAGASFVFGDKLGMRNDEFGVIIAFQVLPIVIFICSLFAILYYFGVMQVFVKGMAIVMQRFMGTSGAESTCVAASIVMGQTEAPVTVRPFLESMTESELFTVMTSGMAHVSGAVMGAYVAIAHVSITHLLTAVIMTAPATIMLAKMFVPETGEPLTGGSVKVEVEKPGVNVIDAAARGAGDGLQLSLNIATMLIAFLSIIAMLNGGLGWLHHYVPFVPESLQRILGLVFSPIAWMLGVSWNDCASVGNLLGTRMVLNEFVAFVDLGKIRPMLQERSAASARWRPAANRIWRAWGSRP
jgi:CNT family concentrative nucleoside transporter